MCSVRKFKSGYITDFKMLHEAVFALGGYPGVLFSESDEKKDIFIKHLHPCERVLVDRITRVAGDYISLKKFIDKNICAVNAKDSIDTAEAPCSVGGYMQAFCNALYDVLQPYREDIVSLEKEILNDPFLPLSHVTYRAEKHALFINVLNRMVNQLTMESLHGCQILGFLRRHLPSCEVKDAVSHILYNCHVLFYKQLTCWLLYGHLMDKHKEFFIEHRKDVSIGTVSLVKSNCGSYATEDIGDNKVMYPAFCDYRINFSMLPPYIPASVAYKILFTGQTILMFGNNVGDGNFSESQKKNISIWGNKEEEFLHKLQELQHLHVFDITRFEVTMNEIRACVTEHLWHVAVENAELFQQLQLIKDFFLLGRGELFLMFIRQVKPILTRNASAQEVNQAFQIAARKVLWTDESALDKFHFVLQKQGQSVSGEKTDKNDTTNWDHLSLQYKISWPLHLLFTDETLEYYNMLFKFLLRVKRVQADLHSMWLEHIKACKTLQGNVFQFSVWKLCTGLIFLIDNLQYYLQADVLESQFILMQNTIQNSQDFEKVQQAHALFQSNILSQTFLRICSTQNEHSVSEGAQTVVPSNTAYKIEVNQVHRGLDQILSLSENFCECMQRWSNPLNEEQLAELLKMDEEFASHVRFLMQLLFCLRSEPCGAHLSQLLLRLDFNRWFSHSTCSL